VNKLGTIFVISILLSSSTTAFAANSDGTVNSFQKISETDGGFGDMFGGPLDDIDLFGGSLTEIGDLDNDGVLDVAVGSPTDDDGTSEICPDCNKGAVWILFLNLDGTVKAKQKISATEGGFTGSISSADIFGISVENIGDLDEDGVIDLAVGARNDDVGGNDRGSIWILFMNTDGTVKSHQKITNGQGGFTGSLQNGDGFGTSIGKIGDLDNDGITDIAVGAWRTGSADRGGVWILFMNTDGTVKSNLLIVQGQNGFTGILDGDQFGNAVDGIGDLNGDGIEDIVVGEYLDEPGGTGPDFGAVWILFLNTDGTVKAHQKIAFNEGGFGDSLIPDSWFGRSVANLGDIDGDGVTDLVVGAPRTDDGGIDNGVIWILFMNTDGTVKAKQKISETEGGFTGTLNDSIRFGDAVDLLEDLNGDGVPDLAVGSPLDNSGGEKQGAIWILFLNEVSSVIGGKLIPIESTSLILAGAQSFSWMIPIVLSGIGIGLFAVSRKN